MKKILRLVMVLFVSIGLCACSNADEEPQVREVIDNYFTSIQSGDYQTAMSYYTNVIFIHIFYDFFINYFQLFQIFYSC